jgi:hypothetical protein
MSDFYAGDVIKTRLEAVGSVTAIVGAPPSRIYKGKTPQNPTYPLVVYKQVGSHRLQGTYSDPGYAQITIQVISLADTLDEAHALDKQIRLALERFGSDQPAGIPFAGGTLYDIKPGSSADGYAPEVDKEFVTTDYAVHHLETTP